jgi:hypothetical protein
MPASNMLFCSTSHLVMNHTMLQHLLHAYTFLAKLVKNAPRAFSMSTASRLENS